jgi:hypothetical protein
MRWFRKTPEVKAAGPDSARLEAMLQHVRQQFGTGTQTRFADQVHALSPMLATDDGLFVAARIVFDVTREARASIFEQAAELGRRTGRAYAVDVRNYRPLWRAAASGLRLPLFGLPCGFHPYVHLPAALAAIGGNTGRFIAVTDPVPVLTHAFELLDLTTSAWEFGRVPVDPDGAGLARRLIDATAKIRTAMKDDHPPLPPAIRELMRSNKNTNVYDSSNGTLLGGINLGAEMRPAYLT